MRFLDMAAGALLFGEAVLSGCVTYSENIHIYDSQGNVYRKPGDESSWKLRRNKPERLAIIPYGTTLRDLSIEYVDGDGVRRKGSYRLDPGKRYLVLRATSGDVWVLDIEREDGTAH